MSKKAAAPRTPPARAEVRESPQVSSVGSGSALERRGVQWSRRAFGLLEVGREIAHEWPADGESNCLLWALVQMETRGGSIELLPSLYGPWLHARWIAPDGSIWEYNPNIPKADIMAGCADMPTLFDGTPSLVSRPAPEPSTVRLGAYVLSYHDY